MGDVLLADVSDDRVGDGFDRSILQVSIRGGMRTIYRQVGMPGRSRQIELMGGFVIAKRRRLLVVICAQSTAHPQRNSVESAGARHLRQVRGKMVRIAGGLVRLRGKVVVEADLLFALPEISILDGGVGTEQRGARSGFVRSWTLSVRSLLPGSRPGSMTG